MLINPEINLGLIKRESVREYKIKRRKQKSFISKILNNVVYRAAILFVMIVLSADQLCHSTGQGRAAQGRAAQGRAAQGRLEAFSLAENVQLQTTSSDRLGVELLTITQREQDQILTPNIQQWKKSQVQRNGTS